MSQRTESILHVRPALSSSLSLTLSLAIFSALSSPAYALDQIVRPYQSTRSAGMGGVRMTTGLYDENFFNNPARVTANPSSKFTLLQLTPEVSKTTIQNISTLASSNDKLDAASQLAGKNVHTRVQLVLPAFYLASNEDRKWALAFGIITSIQVDAILRQSYNLNMDGVADIGPALTYGRKFMKNDELSVGLTGHLTYRAGTNPNYGMLDYVRGTPLTADSIAGDGTMVDFDFGSTYELATLADFKINLGAAIQNIMGGTYSNIKLHALKNGVLPRSQPRSYGLGVSGSREVLGWFHDTILAFEITDIGNSPNGSVFKLLHLGGETHWKFLAFRGGLNQGYWAAGLGIDLHYLTLDFASYGEELGLNVGSLEDRRYIATIGLHI